MEPPPAASFSPASIADDDALLCPACGYDLRGSPSERCSECGLVIDRTALSQSAFPWVRRKHIGRVQAYLQTVWLVTIGSRTLAHEAAKPQDLPGAQRFQAITAAIVAAVFISMLATLAIMEALDFVAVSPGMYGGPRGWVQDLAAPWSAGATITVVLPVLCIAAAICMTTCQWRAIVVGIDSPARRERARAIACYASAPMTFLLPAFILGLPLSVIYGGYRTEPLAAEFSAIALVSLLAAGAILGTLIRTGQWAARVSHAGLLRGCIAALHLCGLWLLGLIILLGFVPWCIGFLWIVIDSFL